MVNNLPISSLTVNDPSDIPFDSAGKFPKGRPKNMIDLLDVYYHDAKPTFLLRCSDGIVTWHNYAYLDVFATGYDLLPPTESQAYDFQRQGSTRMSLHSSEYRDWVETQIDRDTTIASEYYVCKGGYLWNAMFIPDFCDDRCMMFTGTPLGMHTIQNSILLSRQSEHTPRRPDNEQTIPPKRPWMTDWASNSPNIIQLNNVPSCGQDSVDSNYTFPKEVNDRDRLMAEDKISTTESETEKWEPPRSIMIPKLYDWTRSPKNPGDPAIIKRLRKVDWSQTSLGPINTWPEYMRTAICLMTSSPFAVSLWWGPEANMLYNDAYVVHAGSKHPRLLGKTCAEYWSEIWDVLQPLWARVRTSGVPFFKEDDRFFLTRKGFLEETYYTWSLIPLIGPEGQVAALYNTCFEKTKDVISERRLQTLRQVGTHTSEVRSVAAFWKAFINALNPNIWDVPFAVLYSRHSKENKDLYELEGTLGVPQDHPNVPNMLNLNQSNCGFSSLFRDAVGVDYLHLEVGIDLDPNMMHGFKWRGYEEPCRSIVICSVLSPGTTGDRILGLLMIGVNPRRPFDDDYVLFIQLLARQLTTSLATTQAFEAEIKRSEDLAAKAAQDQSFLSEALAKRTREAELSELKFARMADMAPVGIFITDENAKFIYVNDMWSEISQRHVHHDPSAWLDSVHPDDFEIAKRGWEIALTDKKPHTWEFRFRKKWLTSSGVEADRWILAACHPEVQNGNLVSIFGCIMNISDQKLAEQILQKRVAQAAEIKRQQDNFVDVASHEMRNPLSAILQCADSIVQSLTQCQHDKQALAQELDNGINAAETILLCASHQKRVVDDILTLSKLDSSQLLVTTIDVQPTQIVKEALQMFDQEARVNDIAMKFVVHPSYINMGIDHVKIDPTRLMQVLINLLTNALKFIKKAPNRHIEVTLTASKHRPRKTGVFFSKSMPSSLIDNLDELFLTFDVSDTGLGLSESEKNSLFQKFNQATPRTHIHYGGSGLGLFISRELVHLMGGEIGVASESGIGTTFSFYVKCNRSIVDQINMNDTKVAKAIKTPTKTKGIKSASTIRNVASSHKILIVEDNLVNQRVVQRQLKNIGCETVVADNGLDAIDKIKQSRLWNRTRTTTTITTTTQEPTRGDLFDISVILMDIEMPVMNGLVATAEIRRLQREGLINQHVPIIAVSANARPEQIQEMLGAGMDDFLSKPFRIPELIAKLDGLLGDKESEDQA